MKNKNILLLLLILVFLSASTFPFVQRAPDKISDEQKLLQVMHSISSHELFEYVKELASEKYEGRLTGTEGYNASAEWVAAHFKKWGILPTGDNGTFLQAFPIPYTLVFEDCGVWLQLSEKDPTFRKPYVYEDDFIPGSTSGSGEVTAEVVYTGYSITAPELGYDDYKSVDVKGKIILIEREVPVSSNDDADLFKKWRPYSFHQYKLKNAVAQGAKGMLYNYGPISNPNNAYDENFIYSHVGRTVVADVFSGTGRNHRDTVSKIKETLKPQSFTTGKTFTIKNHTEHHPEGIGYNVIGLIEGVDPELKEELIILGGHLDHLGRCYEIMPGANDNASAIAVIMGVAKALAESPIKPKRSVMFLCFGAEEQAVVGSEYYLEHPIYSLEKTKAFINMDGVGCGDKLSARAARNFPELWEFIRNANQKYIHRQISSGYFANLARPRLDAARFMWKDIPTVSFAAYGSRSYYHITKDDIDTITPEIMEDLAQLLFMSILDMANAGHIDFRKGAR